MKSHEDLDVWQRAVDLSVAIYGLTREFPVEEKFGLTNQMRRVSVSIASNRAEGAVRQSHSEFIRFLTIADGSAAEFSTQMIIAERLNYGCPGQIEEIRSEIKRTSRMLQGLINSIRNTLNRNG